MGTPITLDQANSAMHDILEKKGADDPVEPPPAEPEPAPEEPEAASSEEPPAEPVSDDVESLKNRVSNTEDSAAVEKRFQAKLDAIQRRFADNERILRDRYVRKSSVADRALKLLKDARNEAGIDPSDVDRLVKDIEGTMNPMSPSYSPPSDNGTATEDQAMVLNTFLNEKGMGTEEADAFGQWLRGEAATKLSPFEQAVASRDLDGFLRIAHSRFSDGLREQNADRQRTDAVAAVKSVQRTQREAARAASTTTAAPRKQPTGTRAEVDVTKLTKNDISSLLRQSVDQHR